MILLALVTGVALGLRFRIGLVLAATTAIVVLDFGLRIGEDREAASIVAAAALCASIVQGVGFLVHILKHGRDAGMGVRA
jgi:hypothetical protein